jgi:transcriptional regulator with XRE-family HTH domain
MIHPLTKYRKAHGLSKTALAAELGVSKASVTRWESGDRKPDQGAVLAIFKKTGIPPRALRPDLANMIEAAE